MLYLYGLTILAGLANAIQPGQNATLAKALTLPITAGLITLLVSAAIILVGGLATGRLEAPTVQQMGAVPWWAWCGGFLSALVILAQLFAAPTIGAASFLGIIVTVGVLTSIVLDHFGLVGFAVHPASVWRILGAVLMIGGVALVALF